jgi:hypothetical protein
VAHAHTMSHTPRPMRIQMHKYVCLSYASGG